MGFGVVQRRSAQQLHAISTGGALSATGQEWGPRAALMVGESARKRESFGFRYKGHTPRNMRGWAVAGVQRGTASSPMTLLHNSIGTSPALDRTRSAEALVQLQVKSSSPPHSGHLVQPLTSAGSLRARAGILSPLLHVVFSF